MQQYSAYITYNLRSWGSSTNLFPCAAAREQNPGYSAICITIPMELTSSCDSYLLMWDNLDSNASDSSPDRKDAHSLSKLNWLYRWLKVDYLLFICSAYYYILGLNLCLCSWWKNIFMKQMLGRGGRGGCCHLSLKI